MAASPDLKASLDAAPARVRGSSAKRSKMLPRRPDRGARVEAEYGTALRLAHRIHRDRRDLWVRRGEPGGGDDRARAAADAGEGERSPSTRRGGTRRPPHSIRPRVGCRSRARPPHSCRANGRARPCRRFFVVDDDGEICRLVEKIGRTGLFRTRSAGSGDEAVRRAQDLPAPDGALIKVALPDERGDRAGFGVAIRLRAIDGLESLPIAFMSVDDSLSTRVAAAHAGASVFLRDPRDVDAVARTVQTLVEARFIAPGRASSSSTMTIRSRRSWRVSSPVPESKRAASPIRRRSWRPSKPSDRTSSCWTSGSLT